MDESRIQELANAYKAALLDELQSKIALAEAQTSAAVQEANTLANATANGKLDGKNADTRKRQAAEVLSQSKAHQYWLADIKVCEDNAGHATIGRQYYDALIGLTKAWLYSQSGH